MKSWGNCYVKIYKYYCQVRRIETLTIEMVDSWAVVTCYELD